MIFPRKMRAEFTEKIPQIILRDFQFFSDERRTCR